MRLSQYVDAIKKSKSGTITCYKIDPYSFNIVQFCCVFWTFGPSIEGIYYYHTLFNIDGTHLYEKYIGCLLIATRVDDDYGLHPLAFVTVKVN